MNSKVLAATFVLLAPLAAAAQGTSDQALQNQGPMIVERIHSGFLAAPDVKVTDVDHRTSELVGGYAGWVFDDTIFVGGGGYWLANRSSSREMGYGGLVVQWFARSDERIGFGAKALIGGGRATLTDTVDEIIRIDTPIPIVNGRPDLTRIVPPTFRTITTQLRVRDDFFVAEPEADVRLRLTKHARLTAGVGYRLAASERRDDSRLSGAVASVGLQLGGGF
jgi:hypothetical protein